MATAASLKLSLGSALIFGLASMAHAAPFMIVGNDEKAIWDDDGKLVLSAPGKDSVLIIDLAKPESPKIVATLPLKNSVVGPPVNLDIDPTGSIALRARFASPVIAVVATPPLAPMSHSPIRLPDMVEMLSREVVRGKSGWETARRVVSFLSRTTHHANHHGK